MPQQVVQHSVGTGGLRNFDNGAMLLQQGKPADRLPVLLDPWVTLYPIKADEPDAVGAKGLGR